MSPRPIARCSPFRPAATRSNKAGADAFKIDQAEDYAKRSYGAGKKGGGFRATPQSKTNAYDGMVYVFSSKTEARDAHKVMAGNAKVQKVLDMHPGGVHVMYVNATGKIVRYP